MPPPEDPLDEDGDEAPGQPAPETAEPNLSALPIAGLSQRKVASLLGALD